jgi:hypothetical protein
MERTKFMQSIMTLTYPQTVMEAITGGFDGSWERCIEKALRIEVRTGNSEAEVILQAAGGDYLKAAYLITSSQTNATK